MQNQKQAMEQAAARAAYAAARAAAAAAAAELERLKQIERQKRPWLTSPPEDVLRDAKVSLTSCPLAQTEHR
jgi:hypothetical protein